MFHVDNRALGIGFVLSFLAGIAMGDDAATIRGEIAAQQNAWNAGDLDQFMSSYWKSDKLTFSSGGRTVRGWQATLDRYRKRYPDKSTMGELSFRDLEVTILSTDVALVLGRWQLKRTQPIGGNFSLVWQRLDGNWRIVHDHSSVLKREE